MKKPILVSGIQPTGNLHIGNYLGAVQNWVRLQETGMYDMHIFIPDLHSLTSNRTPEEIRANTIMLVIELIAAGIDPKKTTIFVQSHVPAHCELAWIFNCITPMAELERMTQYKDKSKDQAKNINTGLFTYPALMAADILLYHATAIPVGEDQIQHVELTRATARWFNARYGEYFVEPEALLTEIPRVKSLLHPEKKMSKSHGEKSYIALCDEPDVIMKKMKKAVTASEGGGQHVGVENLLLLLKIFDTSGQAYDAFRTAEDDGTIRYGDLKQTLATCIADHFADFRARRTELLNNRDEIAEILANGAHRAQEKASETLARVREMVGIR